MTYGDNDEAQELIDQILEWAKNKSWFDSTFVDDLQVQLLEKDFVTEAQIDALNNIINKFNIL